MTTTSNSVPQARYPKVQTAGAVSQSTPVRVKSKVYRSPFYGQGEHLWSIQPAAWNPKWGYSPQLGLVSADDAFTATRIACEANMATYPETVVAYMLPKVKPTVTTPAATQ